MAGRIPQAFVDDLLARVDIVELIDEHVPLKRAGHDYQALCPFHDERTPSFTVSPRKQFYHCFGCGAHGTAIGFLMQHQRLEFPEAVRALAERVGLPMPEEEGGRAPAAPPTAGLYRVLDGARELYQGLLRDPERGARARDYLAGRGLAGEALQAFAIGYAPPGWDTLTRALGTDPVVLADLISAGLAVPKAGGRPYDRFRDRVMFPILDRRGRTVGFGGRVLDASKPKYLNSPETPVFHKGRELYGLYQAQRPGRPIDRAILVEGYLDVVALAQAGVPAPVATLGTAVTAQHLESLFRAVPRVVFCFDGDAAGRKAAWRALEEALPLLRDGREARFLFLPEGEDPDTLVRRIGGEAFLHEVEASLPLSEVLFRDLLGRAELASLDGRARLVELARPLVARLPQGAFRELVEKRLAELARLDTPELARALAPPSRPGARPPVPSPAPRRPPGRAPSLMRRTIALLVHHPELAASLPDTPDLRPLAMPGAEVLAEVVELLRSRPDLTTAGVLEHFRETEAGRHLARLAREEDPALPGADLGRELRDGLERLARRVLETRYRVLREGARAGELTEDETREYAELCRRLGGR
jgi:DNA primase